MLRLDIVDTFDAIFGIFAALLLAHALWKIKRGQKDRTNFEVNYRLLSLHLVIVGMTILVFIITFFVSFHAFVDPTDFWKTATNWSILATFTSTTVMEVLLLIIFNSFGKAKRELVLESGQQCEADRNTKDLIEQLRQNNRHR